MNKLCLLFLLLTVMVGSCGKRHAVFPFSETMELTLDSGVLKVGTLSRSTSYFNYKGEDMGYEYEMASKFAKSMGLRLDVVTAKDMDGLVALLSKNEVDLIAYPLSITNDYKERVRYTDHEYVTNQVLVQRKNKKRPLLKDVTELIGKEVYVVENSKYHERLKNLNEEIGGGIQIRTVSNEEDEEKLIKRVAEGDIEYTVADNNIADVNKTYYPNIDSHLKVSFDQRSAWAVSLDADSLYTVVNHWFRESKNSYIYQYLYYKYFQQIKLNGRGGSRKYINKHKISVFDGLFKKYAPALDWNWKLLASVAYQESKFDPTVESWMGAKGLMQLMPQTAMAYGMDTSKMMNPEESVKAATAYLKAVERQFSDISDRQERYKFILASYNAGVGHVRDAMALAEKFGKNSKKWDGNVDEYILLKSNPEYFNDPVVKHGYLRGEEVCNFVSEIMIRYHEYMDVIKEK
ncbi:MAG: transporter substrate-binding domain-containing protein [Prevotellaceae bacterium]|nr:transporter substrate-binding domain-containing protein [Prevotellaceae bacterium]